MVYDFFFPENEIFKSLSMDNLDDMSNPINKLWYFLQIVS